MKNFILLFLTVMFTYLGINAQEATTDYIYSSDGFEVKVAHYDTKVNTVYNSTGLYSKDGKILVSAISDKSSRFYVLDGCETIASGAFQSVLDCEIYIPSSVKYIAPDAITSKVIYVGGTNSSSHKNKFGGIYNIETEDNGSSSANTTLVDSNATEVARYNVQGVKLVAPAKVINIVQKSDGTAEKVLIQ